MTVSAHDARHVYHGATRAPVGRAGTRSDWYKEMHPEMYADIPSSKPVKAPPKAKPRPQPQRKTELQKQSAARTPRVSAKAIRAHLISHGDATAAQIAQALGLSREAVYMCLWRGIDGIEQKGMYLPEKGSPSQLWGVAENGA